MTSFTASLLPSPTTAFIIYINAVVGDLDDYSLKRSSSVTSDWTMPQWPFLRSPYVVTKVRWQLSREPEI